MDVDGHCITYDVSNLVASLLEDFKSGEKNNEKPYLYEYWESASQRAATRQNMEENPYQ
jgi:hypothetical protein